MHFSLVLRALLAVLPLAWSAGSKAPPVIHGCERVLLEVQTRLGPAVSDDFLGPVAPDREPTIRQVHELFGQFGGRTFVIERTGGRWVSAHRTVRFDPQGDPRWLIDILGPEAARFLGFQILDDTHMMVPDAREFSNRLARLNAELSVPILIGFYSTPTNENVKLAEYVKEFAATGRIPIAAGGNHLWHDLSWHTGAILLSPELMTLKRMSAAYLEGFIAHLVKKNPEGAKARAIKYFAYLWRFRETQSIDLGTAMINPGIVTVLRDPAYNHDSFLRSGLKMMSNEAVSLPEHLRRFVTDLRLKSKRAEERYAYVIKSEKVRVHLEALSVAEMQHELAEYQTLTDPTGNLTIEPYLKLKGSRTLDRLCRGLQTRRLEISAVAARLQAQLL